MYAKSIFFWGGGETLCNISYNGIEVLQTYRELVFSFKILIGSLNQMLADIGFKFLGL